MALRCSLVAYHHNHYHNQKAMEELKRIIETKEEKLQIAAVFGKQLLEDNKKLKERLEIQSSEHIRKVEELEQEKYKFKMSLDLKEQIEKCQAAEIESLKEHIDSLTKSNGNLIEREKKHQQKLSELTKEKSCLEEIQEEISKNATKWKERANLLETLSQVTQDQLHQSILNETCSEEISCLKKDLQQLSVEKQQLEQMLSDVNCELESCRKQERKLAENLESTLEMLREKNSEIATYLKTIEQYKDEIHELKLEEEMMKMGQRDVNARGNSLFAEVDDRRRSVEKQLISMKLKYKDTKEKLSFSVQEMNKMKYQMATLLGMASQKSDVAYIQNLEQTLEIARQEIKELKQQLSEAEKITANSQQHIDNVPEDAGSDNYNYLKVMLKQSRKECEDLKKELQNALLYKAAETDRAINFQRNLYQEQKKLLELQATVVHLQTKIDELQKKDDISVPKPTVEKLPDCNKENVCEQQVSAKKKVVISNDAEGKVITDKLKDSNSKLEHIQGRRVEAPVIDISKPGVSECKQQ